MAKISDLYQVLQGQEYSVTEKLQIAKYVLTTPDVNMPNKEQRLIDWLCDTLTKSKLKKKSSTLAQEDIQSIWICLVSMLHSSQTNSEGHKGVRIKSEFCQVVIESFDVFQDCPKVIDTLVDFTAAALSNTVLNNSLFSKYESVITLLNKIMRIKTSNQETRTKLILCQEKVLEKLKSLQKFHHSSKQVYTHIVDKLLLCLLEQESQEETSASKKLKSYIFQGLFSKDMASTYTLYLDVFYAKESKSQLPNNIVHLLEKVNNGLNTNVVRGLHILYQGFLSMRLEDPQLSFKMLRRLCKLIHIEPEGSISIPVKQEKDMEVSQKEGSIESSTFEIDVYSQNAGLLGILQEVLKGDSFSAAYDNTTGQEQLKWYRSLVTLLLNQSERDGTWYTCLGVLLQINSSFIEPQIEKLWEQLFTTEQSDPKVIGASERLQCDIISLYLRMRQIPRLLTKILHNFSSMTSVCCNVFSSTVLDEFGACTEQLPQGSVVDIWSMFISDFTSNYQTNLGATSRQLFCVSQLISTFLMHIRVADYAVTSVTRDKVNQLMGQTMSDVIEPMLKYVSQQRNFSQDTTSALLLSYTWVELHLLLKQYTKYDMTSGDVERVSATAHYDLSGVFPCLDVNMWRNIYEEASKSQDKTCLHILDMLYMQKMKALLLHCDVTEPSIVTSLQNLIEYFVSKSFIETENSATWDRNMFSITSETYPISKWKLLLDYLPLVCASQAYSSDTIATIADVLIDSLLLADSEKLGDLTMSSCSKSFLSSDQFKELAILHTAMLQGILGRLGNIFKAKSKSPKKLKGSNSVLVNTLEQFQSIIGSQSVDEEFIDVSEAFNQTCQNDKQTQIEELCSTLKASAGKSYHCRIIPKRVQNEQLELCRTLQTLEYLPMASIPQQQRTCFSLTAFLLIGIERNSGKSEELIQILCSIILTCSNDGRNPQFTNYLDKSTALCWLLNNTSSKSEKVCKLLESLVLVLLNASVKTTTGLEGLSAFINNLLDKLAMWETGSCNVWTARVMLFTLKTLSKVSKWSNMKEEVTKPCKLYFLTLSKQFIKVIDQTLKDDVDSAALPYLVSGYITLIGCHKMLADIPWKSHLDAIVQLSLKTFDNKDKGVFKMEVSLNLMNILCTHYVELEDFLPDDFLNTVWNRLEGYLQRVNKKTGTQDNINSPATGTQDPQVDTKEDIVKTNGDLAGTKEEEDVIEGDMAKLESKVIWTLGKTLKASPLSIYQDRLNKLVKNMDSSHIGTDAVDVATQLKVWLHLLKTHSELKDEKLKYFNYVNQNATQFFQSMLVEATRVGRHLTRTIVLPILEAQSMAISMEILPVSHVAMCLTSCTNAPLDITIRESSKDGNSTETDDIINFRDVFSATYKVLNEMLVHYRDNVFNFIPPFIAASKRLMNSAIVAGDQANHYNSEQVAAVVACGHLTERLYALMASYKVEFSKVAVYIVADYVTQVQKVTLVPIVKKSLVPAVNHILSICDEHAIAQLHTVLNPGVREVFRTLYDDYLKYFKYTGKI
ncbi:unnamed protein product [Owenia fusiformis]|uniref:Nucleolar 27S pre-rRNA processing Urb2/Npa2 C-terminal domain-containing protein n=1 Tax=Owenia fusiformis TaxID=6347 RepID=A0A8S4PUB2_OWEFU|nr:unnamed protein product [Owenia fusiformis]